MDKKKLTYKLFFSAILGYILHFPLRFVEDAFMGWLQTLMSKRWGVMMPVANWFINNFVGWILPFILAGILVWFVYRFAQKEKRGNIPNGKPKITIQIDDCSWGNPKKIGIELVRLINVAFTLCAKNPPVNVTDLQLYIEDGMQKLVDSNPVIPFRQENTKVGYIASFGFSYSSPNFVVSNQVKKYQLRVMANGKWFDSEEFSPKDFSRSLVPDKAGSQT